MVKSGVTSNYLKTEVLKGRMRVTATPEAYVYVHTSNNGPY